MKCECMIVKMRDIILNADKFFTKKMDEERIPVIKNHVSLFFILSDSDSPKQFNEIYREWGISKSSLSDIVNKYQKIGLMEKYSYADDKRTVLIHLTDEGLKVKQRLVSLEKEFLDSIYVGLDSEEKESFERLLDHVLKNSTLA